MSDTPRTDAVTEHYYTAGGLRSASVVRADFARELERDLAQRTSERDALKHRLDLQMEGANNLVAQRERAMNDRDALAAELAALKAERDEARRQACYFEAKYIDRCACPPYMSISKYVTQDAMRLAKDRGWDCFKEVQP